MPDGGRRPPALYRWLLGDRFELLPTRVRELHDLTEPAVWVGRADVECGRSWFARAVAVLFALPADGKGQPLHVSFTPGNGQEVWTRRLGARTFRSVQLASSGLLAERIGVSCLLSSLEASAGGLSMRLQEVCILGISLPRILHPRVRTFESEQDGRYRFEAEAHLPLAGLLVRYAGWLERADEASA